MGLENLLQNDEGEGNIIDRVLGDELTDPNGKYAEIIDWVEDILKSFGLDIDLNPEVLNAANTEMPISLVDGKAYITNPETGVQIEVLPAIDINQNGKLDDVELDAYVESEGLNASLIQIAYSFQIEVARSNARALTTGSDTHVDAEANIDQDRYDRETKLSEQAKEAVLNSYNEFKEQIDTFEGYSEVRNLSGNGGRPVGILGPNTIDPNKPTYVLIYLHGSRFLINTAQPELEGTGESYEVGSISPGADRLRQVMDRTELLNNNINLITVHPLSEYRRATSTESSAYLNAYDDEWFNSNNSTGDDAAIMLEQALSIAGSHYGNSIQNYTTVIGGQSSGGKAVSNALNSGFRADIVEYYDASYGNWAPEGYEAGIATNPDMQFHMYAIDGTPTDLNNSSNRVLSGRQGVNMTQVDRSSGPNHGNFPGTFMGAAINSTEAQSTSVA